VSARGISHLIVTGAHGYLGAALVDAALAAGYRVTLLTRGAKSPRPALREIPWRLGEALPQEALDPAIAPDAQALVHLAHDWRDSDVETGANTAGARILRDGARALGLGRSIFISSVSARADALNAYGRMKWRIEQLFDAENEISLRVGLVYGGPKQGQYGLLCKLSTFGMLPMVRPQQLVQPIRRSEVARGILLAVESSLSGTLGLAGAEPIAFSTFLDELAWRLRGGRMRLIPLPLDLVLFACAIVNAVPLLPHLDRERILGLAGTRSIETAADLRRLGLDVAPFAQGMLAEPAARRALFAEGRTLLCYASGAPADTLSLRLYARAFAKDGALRLPRLVHVAPWLIRFIEPVNGQGVLAKRLKLATALVSSDRSLDAFDRRSRLERMIRLLGTLLVDAAAMPMRLLATRWSP
jgi:nucleoside-diphosphate-sugar epimerase